MYKPVLIVLFWLLALAFILAVGAVWRIILIPFVGAYINLIIKRKTINK